MYLPPLQPVSNPDIRISGDVNIHPSAILAPGVILQAAPDSSIVIGAEVCIGMGTIINAYQGCIEIESGAILGSGVLIVGAGKIGINACVGTATTIFNQSIPSMATIAPGSLIGDTSRSVKNLVNNAVETNSQTLHHNSQVHEAFSTPKSTNTSEDEENFEQATINNGFKAETNQTTAATSDEANNGSVELELETNNSKPKASKKPVVGQVYINELMLTLFPHHQYLNHSNSKDEE